jgi:alkylation response protein AidB-like acyl-CoA dehydrogenase
MNFDLSDEQKQFEDGIERLLSSTIDLPAMTKGAEVIKPTRERLKQKLAELGTPAILVSAERGGLGMGLLTLTVLADCFGRHAAPTDVLQSALAAWLIAVSGDDKLRGRWLEPLMTGGAQAAFALDEGGEAWAPDKWRVRRSDAAARKVRVEGADRADLVIAGVADGFVALEASEVQVDVSGREPLDMTRPTSEVSFAPSAGRSLGEGLTQRIFDALLVLHAADAVGAGCRAYQMAVGYAKTREQFGRPIGSYQGLKHQLANMAVDIEPARFLVWYAAHAWDQISADASRAAALAKAHAGDVAVKTARAAVEAHGGIGYTWEYPLHLFLKRAMYDRMVLGSSAVLRARVATLSPYMTA